MAPRAAALTAEQLAEATVGRLPQDGGPPLGDAYSQLFREQHAWVQEIDAALGLEPKAVSRLAAAEASDPGLELDVAGTSCRELTAPPFPLLRPAPRQALDIVPANRVATCVQGFEDGGGRLDWLTATAAVLPFGGAASGYVRVTCWVAPSSDVPHLVRPAVAPTWDQTAKLCCLAWCLA